MELKDLPGLNALLNSVSAVLLVTGWLMIRRGKESLHKTCMLAAVGSSTLFLVSYLIYHYQVGSVKYQGEGWLRALYLAILLTHTVLAALIVPLVLRTLYLALRDRRPQHKKWARVTLPLWLYVSVTGVVIYVMLYHGPGRG